MSIDFSFIRTILSHAAAVHGIETSGEDVRLARLALNRLSLIGRGNERDRRPTEDEINELIEHFESKPRQLIPIGRIIRFAIATAMRQEEICRIEWLDIDMKKHIPSAIGKQDGQWAVREPERPDEVRAVRIEREQATEQQSCCRRTNGEINDQQPEQRYAENRHGSRQVTKSSEGRIPRLSSRVLRDEHARQGAAPGVCGWGPRPLANMFCRTGQSASPAGPLPGRPVDPRQTSAAAFARKPAASGRPFASRRAVPAQAGRRRTEISQSPPPECSSSNKDRPVFGQSPTASPSNFKDSAFASGCVWSRHLVLYEPDNGGQDRARDPAPSNLADKRTDIYLIGG